MIFTFTLNLFLNRIIVGFNCSILGASRITGSQLKQLQSLDFHDVFQEFECVKGTDISY